MQHVINDWNVGKRVSFFDMAKLFGKAYMQTADMANASAASASLFAQSGQSTRLYFLMKIFVKLR